MIGVKEKANYQNKKYLDWLFIKFCHLQYRFNIASKTAFYLILNRNLSL